MAIFYKHIKGCDATANTWSFLEWSENNEGTMASAPTIKIKDDKTAKDSLLGHIITEKATNQVIKNKIFCESGITTESFYETSSNAKKWLSYNRTGWGPDSSESEIIIDTTTMTFSNVTSTTLPGTLNMTGAITGVAGITMNANSNTISGATLTNTKGIVGDASGSITNFTNIDISGQLKGNIVKCNNKCEALYFNATSDRRAKTNIIPSQFKGLDIVNALPIYNFDYKDTGTPSIGIMAQDAAIEDLGTFNLVDNLNASGEDDDFMSIKESKLVYVLWKAVQELSQEVENLKQQLNK